MLLKSLLQSMTLCLNQYNMYVSVYGSNFIHLIIRCNKCMQKAGDISFYIAGKLMHNYEATKSRDGFTFVRTHKSSSDVLRHHQKVKILLIF